MVLVMFQWLLNPIYEILRIVKQNQTMLVAIKADIVALRAQLAAVQTEQVAQRTLLEQILVYVTPPPSPPPASCVVFMVEIDGQVQEVTGMTIKPRKQFTATVVFKDQYGNIAKVDGLPEWTNDNDTVIGMAVAADAMSAVISSPAGPGSGQVSVSADADLGAGIVTITGVLAVEVIPDDAVLVEVNTGEVTDMTPTEPPARKRA